MPGAQRAEARQTVVELEGQARRAGVREIIAQGLLKVAFQPIVDLQTREIHAYEALARPQGSRFRSVPELYEAAAEVGLVGELGRLQRTVCMKTVPDKPLFLNVHPAEFDYGWLVRPDEPLFRHRHGVYLEVTESVPLSHFDQCHAVLSELRKKGVKLAIDDFGAGFSNLKYIAELTPEIVKLDKNLLEGAEYGSRSLRLMASIITLCRVMGAKVVVEGIETEEEFSAARHAGADYVQGYLMGKPEFL